METISLPDFGSLISIWLLECPSPHSWAHERKFLQPLVASSLEQESAIMVQAKNGPYIFKWLEKNKGITFKISKHVKMTLTFELPGL